MAEADAIVADVRFVFVHLEQYIDVADFETPIRFNIKGFQYYMQRASKYIEFEIGSHRANLQDSALYSGHNA